MVTASQLQILQSPITGLISSVSTSVNVKLDDSNYLNWHFQMELMLEGYGIIRFVDGSSPCPPRFVSSSSVASEVSSGDSSANVESDEYKLITATLSPVAVSCAIGSTSSQDIWTRLKDNFSTVSRTNIVILALNGLPSEYNTFRCVIRGREKVISLKEFRSQLLAEEGIVDARVLGIILLVILLILGNQTMVFGNTTINTKGRARFLKATDSTCQGSLLGHAPPQAYGSCSDPYNTCQLCYQEGHTAPFCPNQFRSKPKCYICGRQNHTAQFCFHKDKDPRFSQPQFGMFPNSSSLPPYSMQAMNTVFPNSSQSTPGLSSNPAASPPVWIADSGATNHMTADFNNLTVATPYPTSETVHTANGEALLTAVNSLHKIPSQSSTAAPFTHPLPIPNSLNELVTFPYHSSSHTSSIPVSPSLSPHSPVVTPLHHSVSTPPSLVPSQPVISNPVSQSITAAANSYPEIPVATDFSPDSLSKSGIVKKKALLTIFDESPPVDLSLDDGQPYNNPTMYRSIVGALQYLTFTRPDIAFSVHQVCQFMQAPMNSHFTAVKRILRYLKGTMHLGLTYSKGDLSLKSFSDADWAGDPNDRRSTTGLVVFLGTNPISWSSKKQQTVSRSSTEAEYRALSSTAAELDWIQQLLAFLKVSVCSSPVLFCDNLSAIALSFNPVQHQRTKHIEIDVHFVRERVAKNKLIVQFVSSQEQFADILTKGLSAPLFRIHCTNLMLGSSTHEIVGGC
ncbi:hypothetical protein D8674_035246 [Pyrus ussuriensis x Pyrus communis]|uniref:CCHC-type domain-containing protein n=1 Tax=Pyrus ussuriensis x Pyrus communis TaxID=2448454 RepID=A0A5N5GHY4_9ROSA|nr:hypothetical protein D8674_035246 [Pyrus ussuriensis x Pyrus communis]